MRKTHSSALLCALICFCLPENSAGQIYSYTIGTAVGQYPYGDGGPPTAALLSFPPKIAIDSHGAIYIADQTNNKVRKVTGGVITTVAGTGIPGYSGDGANAADAQLWNPAGVAVDKAGNVYIYESVNEIIRKVDANGIITTFAGTVQKSGSSGDGGPATQALLALNGGGNVAVDSAGNVYISDTLNSAVRKVTAATGIISTFAGISGKPGGGGDGGAATAANLYYPGGISFDTSGNLYIADTYNQKIRMVSAQNGVISTVAGNGQAGATGDGGAPKLASLSYPADVAVDATGDLYIADTGNSKFRKVTVGASPSISTLAGTGAKGYSGDGGPATAATFIAPYGVAVDSSGAVYLADTGNSRIRSVRGANIAAFAGASHAQGDGASAAAALLYFPQRLAWDGAGNLYIADNKNNRVRKVSPNGNISTIAGNGSYLVSGDGGPALAAGVSQPQAVATDSSGNVFIATENRIRKVDANGNISTVVNTANTAGFGGDGAAATAAMINDPLGLTVDSAGNLYIADSYNHRIRKVSAGVITTIAGSGPICGSPCNPGSFSGDGGPATSATLAFPFDVAFDASGNLLIADTNNNRIRRVDGSGNISTIAGSSVTAGYGGDLSPAASALMFHPTGIAADNAGNLYISDTGNEVIRTVDGLGVISTIAGTNKTGFSGDGGPATSAGLDYPYGIAADPAGNVWFVDSYNHRVRKLTPSGPLVGNGPLGIVNAASFVSGGLVPGGMATLFGSKLTSSTGINLASALPLASQLLNSSVKINNTLSAPIFAVDNVNGQQQINFQVPWELAGQSTAVLQVVNDGALSPTVVVPVLNAQPAVFAYYVGANTFGVVLHADYQLADTAHPVTAGEVVLIYCTSLGAVSPTIKDGAAGTGKELTVAKPSVTLGGESAPVSFSGLAPGFAGLYQINVQIPAGLASGNQTLSIAISGASSKPVLLPVK